MQYRKKPVVIEARELTKDNWSEVLEWCGGKFIGNRVDETLDCLGLYVTVDTLGGTSFAAIGDFIVKGVHGEFYPCKHDIFLETHEPCE